MMATAELLEVEPIYESAARRHFDVERVRADFPILKREVYGKPLVYLDNAATTQKPQAVIDSLTDFYTNSNANIHRGVHHLSDEATLLYEDARRTVQHYLGVADSREIVFVRGATEGINLVAQTYGRQHVRSGDEVIISTMEHHSNIVPWQMLCEQAGATLRVVPINDAGELQVAEFERMLGPRTKFVALTHVSNALGTINPVGEAIQLAHQWNVPVLIDGAQAAPHLAVDVQDLDCDFYVCSGHKLYGPTGIGVLYGRRELLDEMPPYQSGGDMIQLVTLDKTTFNELPYKFEAGTPNIAGAMGLAAAIEYLSHCDGESLLEYEQELLDYATSALSSIDGLQVIGEARNKTAVISFVMKGIHPHDIGTILDREGIAIRTGHHCAQPVMERFGVPATSRISLGLYNTHEEIDKAVEALHKAKEIFRC